MRAEAAGVQMITIHGRTRCQFYKGQADWAAIRAVKDAVGVPVVANGDITDADSARSALDLSGADGVMIGRGAQGRPWVLAQVAQQIWGSAAPEVPQGDALTDMVCGHYEAMLSFYGADLGLRVARKHLGWRLLRASDGAPWGENLRRRLVRLTDPKRVRALLEEAARRLEDQAPLEEWSAAA